MRDYGALYWPTNFRNGSGDYQAIRHVQTGFYGIVLDVKRGDLSAFGELVDEVSPEAAMAQGSEVVASLPTASVGYSVVLDGPEQAATGFFGTGGDADNPSRVIDMGRFMQRVDIPEVKYSGDNRLSGSVQLAAMTRHFVLTHRAASSQGGPMTLRIEIEGDAVSRFDETEWLDGSRAVSVRDADGQGWSFVIPEQAGATPMLTRLSNGGLLFEMKYESVTPNEPVSLSVIAIPAGAATDAQLPVWVHPEETVKVQSAQLARDGSGGEVLTDAVWDAERGLFLISLRDLSEVGGTDLGGLDRLFAAHLVQPTSAAGGQPDGEPGGGADGVRGGATTPHFILSGAAHCFGTRIWNRLALRFRFRKTGMKRRFGTISTARLSCRRASMNTS